MRKTSWLLAIALVLAGCGTSNTPPASQPTTTGGGGGSNDVTVSFKGQVVPVLQNHCARCHVAGNPDVPFTMFNADGSPKADTVAFRITDMIAAIRAKKMPKDAPGSVSDAELATLEAWSAQGAENN